MTYNIPFPDAFFAKDSSGTRILFLKKGGKRRLNKT
jgi:hypothetical protein